MCLPNKLCWNVHVSRFANSMWIAGQITKQRWTFWINLHILSSLIEILVFNAWINTTLINPVKELCYTGSVCLAIHIKRFKRVSLEMNFNLNWFENLFSQCKGRDGFQFNSCEGILFNVSLLNTVWKVSHLIQSPPLTRDD